MESQGGSGPHGEGEEEMMMIDLTKQHDAAPRQCNPSGGTRSARQDTQGVDVAGFPSRMQNETSYGGG